MALRKPPFGAAPALALALGLAAACDDGDPSRPAPAPHVAMQASLDGMGLDSLQAVRGRFCASEPGTLRLGFSAHNDPLPYAADDEMSIQLWLDVQDVATLPVGTPIDVAATPGLDLRATVSCYCDPRSDSAPAVEGTLLLASLGPERVAGAAHLVFAEPGDPDPLIHEEMIVDLEFVLEGHEDCPTP
jgi:hypothetical protein